MHFHIYPMYDCECSGLYQEDDPMAMRRNDLELTLEPVYNCNLGCFAAWSISIYIFV